MKAVPQSSRNKEREGVSPSSRDSSSLLWPRLMSHHGLVALAGVLADWDASSSKELCTP